MSESQYFSAKEGSIESVGILGSGIRALSLQEMSTGFRLNARPEDSTSTAEPTWGQNQLSFDDASNAAASSNRQSLQEHSSWLSNSTNELSSRPDELIRDMVDHPIASSITRLAAMGVFSKISGFGLINPVVREDSLSIVNQPPVVLDRVPYARRPRIWPIPEPSSNVDPFPEEQPVPVCSNSSKNLSSQTLINQNMVDVAYKLLALNPDGHLGAENPGFTSRRVGNINIGNKLRPPPGFENSTQHVQHLVASQLQKLNNRPIRDEDIPLGDSASTFGGEGETVPYGKHKYGSMESAQSNEVYGDVCKGKKLSSNLRDQAIPIHDDLINQRVVNVANQLLASRNSGKNLEVKNPYFASDMTEGDIAQDYLKLYASTCPENYDFAMNIMAYVELLNDNSWTATHSHFDENVKQVIKYMWDEQKPDFDKWTDLRTLSRAMILKLLFDLTQFSIYENFDLSQLLNYSVTMCLIGVFARKHIFKTAPLYVICQLRERIKSLKFETIVQFLFEIAVKDFSQKLVQHLRV